MQGGLSWLSDCKGVMFDEIDMCITDPEYSLLVEVSLREQKEFAPKSSQNN